MGKLKVSDLARIKDEMKKKVSIRSGEYESKITVHMGTCGIAAGAREVMSALMEEVEKHNLDKVIIATSGCAGLCSKEPMITVEERNSPPVKYINLDGVKVRKIVEGHVMSGNIVNEYAYAVGNEQAY